MSLGDERGVRGFPRTAPALATALDGDVPKRNSHSHTPLLAEDTILYDPEAVAERARRLLPDVTIDLANAGHGLASSTPGS